MYTVYNINDSLVVWKTGVCDAARGRRRGGQGEPAAAAARLPHAPRGRFVYWTLRNAEDGAALLDAYSFLSENVKLMDCMC